MYVDSSGWESNIRNAVGLRNQLKVAVRGQRVAAVKTSHPDICLVPAPPAPYVPTPFPNVDMALRAAGLVTLAALIAYAVAAGYGNVGVRYDAHAAGQQDDELSIFLR